MISVIYDIFCRKLYGGVIQMTRLIRRTNGLTYLILLFSVSVLLFGCSSKGDEEVAERGSSLPELKPMPVSLPASSKTLTLKQIKENSSLLTLDATFSGEVVEANDIREYTYVRLKDSTDTTVWVAVSRPPRALIVGETIKVTNANVMTDFFSKGQDKTFDFIIFGQVFGLGDVPTTTTAMPAPGYEPGYQPTMTSSQQASDAKVQKASEPNAYTVEEIFAQRDALKDKEIVIRGTVVRYNEGIMGKNWLHLRDGTGSIEHQNNDITVTTDGRSSVGSVVVAKGMLRVGKDFGAGYSFNAIIEDAQISIEE